MSLFFRVSGIVLTLMVFLGCGILIGAHKPATVMASGRFEKLTETTAFDTKTGQTCDTKPDYSFNGNGPPPPNGFRKDTGNPLCSELSSR